MFGASPSSTFQREIASANARAGRAIKTPSEEEILQQAVAAEEARREAQRRESSDSPSRRGHHAAPATPLGMGAASSSAAGPASGRHTPVVPASGRHTPSSASRAQDSPGRHTPSSASSAQAHSNIRPPRPGFGTPGDRSRPSWLGVARRLPPSQRAALIGGSSEAQVDTGMNSPSAPSHPGGPTSPRSGAHVASSPDPREDLLKDLQSLKARHEAEMRALRAEMETVKKDNKEMAKKNQQLEREVSSNQRSHASELDRLRSEISGREKECSQVEMDRQRFQRDLQGAQQRLQALQSENADLQKQLQQQRQDTQKLNEGLEEELRKCREMHLQTAHCAEQERMEKVRAMQEARMYRSLLDDSNLQMQDFNHERQQWSEERAQLEEAQQVLQLRFDELLNQENHQLFDSLSLSKGQICQDDQLAQLRELQEENLQLRDQHVNGQARHADLLRELLTTQTQLERAEEDLASLQEYVNTQEERAPALVEPKVIESNIAVDKVLLEKAKVHDCFEKLAGLMQESAGVVSAFQQEIASLKARKDQNQQVQHIPEASLALQATDEWWTKVLAPVHARFNEERQSCQAARKEATHWKDRAEELREDLECKNAQLSAETALRGQVSAAVALAKQLASPSFDARS